MQNVYSLKFFKLKNNIENIESVKAINEIDKIYKIKMFFLCLFVSLFLFSIPFIFGFHSLTLNIILSKIFLAVSFAFIQLYMYFICFSKFYEIKYKDDKKNIYCVCHQKEIDLLNSLMKKH